MAVLEKIKKKSEELDAKNKALHDIFVEAGPDMDMSLVKCIDGDSKAKTLQITERNDEITALAVEIDGLKALQAIGERVASGDDDHVESGSDGPKAGSETETKSVGQRFVESPAYKNKQGQVGPESHLDVDLKTLMTRSAGWSPESTRSGLTVEIATRPLQVTDLIPTVPWKQAAYKYMEETTRTNNAAEVAEGATYGEAAFAFTERTVTIEKIGVWLPVTDEQLEDETHAAAWLDEKLPFMVRQRLDGQILLGDGVTPNILGVNLKPGIQTQAKGGDPTEDAVFKAMTKVRVTGRAVPNAVIFHPNDWQEVRLHRTADGIYIWGSPSDVGPARIWGVRVVESDAQTENTAVVGDFANYSLLAVRRGMDIQTTNSHASDFINGKQAIRADIRVATIWTRAAAFATVTGI